MQRRELISETHLDRSEITWYVDKIIKKGEWKPVTLPPELVGLHCPVTIFEAKRKSNFITQLKMNPVIFGVISALAQDHAVYNAGGAFLSSLIG